MSTAKAAGVLGIVLASVIWANAASAQFVPPQSDVHFDYNGFVTPEWKFAVHVNGSQIGSAGNPLEGGTPFIFDYPQGSLDQQSFYTFCIEPTQYLPNPPADVSFDVLSPSGYTFSAGPGAAERMSRLYGTVVGSSNPGDYHPELWTDDKRFAFQFAIWEVAFETGTLNAGSGYGFYMAPGEQPAAFQTKVGNAISQANTWLTAISAANYNGPTLDLLYLQSDDIQDQILVVPEPATWAAIFGGASLAVALLVRSRHRRLVA